MSAVLELTDALIKAGLTPAAAAMLVVRAGVEMAAAVPSKGALRTRNYRARLASQTVTGDAPVTPEPNVTERHKASQSVTSDNASLSSLLTDSEKKLSEKKEKREAKRASQLPDGWRPAEHVWQASVDRIGAARCELELLKFRNHAADKGRVSKDWNAAWRNWVDRAIDYGAKNGRRTIHDAANDLLAKVRAFDDEPPGGIRGGTGEAPVRLLSSG